MTPVQIVMTHLSPRIASEALMTRFSEVLPLDESRSRQCFFSNNVLLVEGPTEQTLITRLLADKKIDGPRGGLYVLDCMGKYNIHRFMNVLSRLGISHAVIFDDDNQKDFHPELHQLIRDSKHPQHTVHLEALAGDIEALLDIPVLDIPVQKETRRKPQHMMYHYSTGTIKKREPSVAL